MNSKGWKPEGMHWDTFSQLVAEHDSLVRKSLNGMVGRFGLLRDSWEPD